MQQEHSPLITTKVPLDQDGYVQSFPVKGFDPEAVRKFYDQFGFVVFDDVLNSEEIDKSVDDLWTDLGQFSKGAIKRNDEKTWSNNQYLGSLGFLNNQPISQPQLWRNRAHPNVYSAFKKLYEITSKEEPLQEPLLAIFDRGSLLRPAKANQGSRVGGFYHFDIAPWLWTGVEEVVEGAWRVHNMYSNGFEYWLSEGNYVPRVKNFTKLQGVLAFSNTNQTSGGFECVCGFQNYIRQWCINNPDHPHITECPQLMANFQKIYQRAGSMLVFSRQLPHNIYSNESQNFRYAQYLRMAPESSLMLLPEEKKLRKKQVRKMLPNYVEKSSAIAKEVFMLEGDERGYCEIF